MRLATKLMMGAGVLALSTGIAAAAPAVVENDVNLRAGPGVEYPVVTAMPAGATVDVMGCEAGWCRVAFNGAAGFASRAFIGLGGGVAVAPAAPMYRGYAEGYGYGGSAPAYGYAGTYAYGGYSPGYSYGYSETPAYGARFGYAERERRFGNERGFGAESRVGEETTTRGARRFNEQGAARGERMSAGTRDNEARAQAIKGNNPMRVRASTANPNLPRAQGQAQAIKGNNPMRVRASTANPNLPRAQGQAQAIKGNNPMRIRAGTSGGANATTGAAPRENRPRQNY